jgi:hypothetical protein
MIKAGIGLPMRELRRYLRASGVVLAGKKRQRDLAKELVGDITSEPVPMSFSLPSGGEELRAAPFAYSPNLNEKVIQILERNAERYVSHSYTSLHEQSGGLQWHNRMPLEKIGGDAGGATNFQIVNTQSPNSPHNTCVFAISDAKDTTINLHVALDRFQDDIESLNTVWK